MIFYKKSKSLIHENHVDCRNVKNKESYQAIKSPLNKEFVKVSVETADAINVPIRIPRECK